MEGANKTKPKTKPTGNRPRGALAPLTRRSKPNQTNQTHTIDGEKGHDSSFECALQLVLALVAPEESIQPQLLALIASNVIFQHCRILWRSPSGSVILECTTRFRSCRLWDRNAYFRELRAHRKRVGGVISGTFLPMVSALPDHLDRLPRAL